MNCLICGEARSRVVDQLTGGELRKLWQAMGQKFTDAAWDRFRTDASVELQRCEGCGFEFFAPGLAGNALFYQELDVQGYYCPDRPEFARTLEFAKGRSLKKVLDVGCGSGMFLDMARQNGCDTYGLELSPVAAEQAKAKGHTIFSRLLHELTEEDTRGGFELITLFQVLEHVGEPVGMLRQAARLLSPGGYISIAVPSAEGVYRLVPLDPHQWPPHHLSRWRQRDFARLAREARLRLIESGGDILLGSEIKHMWNLQNKLAPALGRKGHGGGTTLPRAISFLYRKSGMKFIFPRWGLSLYAVFGRES